MKIAFSSAAALLLIDVMSASAGNLAGQYQVTGKNVDGSTYSGTAQIVVTSDTTCRISWQTDAAASQGLHAERHKLRGELYARRRDRARALPDQARRNAGRIADDLRQTLRRHRDAYADQLVSRIDYSARAGAEYFGAGKAGAPVA